MKFKISSTPVTVDRGILIVFLIAILFVVTISWHHAEKDRDDLKANISLLIEIEKKIEHAAAIHEAHINTHHIHNPDGTITEVP